MAPDVGSAPRHMRRRISGYVAADVTPVTGQQTTKMWNYFFPRPLGGLKGFLRFHRIYTLINSMPGVMN
jgi:hypothetical protein